MTELATDSFTKQSARRALEQAAWAAGLPAGSAELIRLGSNAVYLHPDHTAPASFRSSIKSFSSCSEENVHPPPAPPFTDRIHPPRNSGPALSPRG
jgi:hypothetical protein